MELGLGVKVEVPRRVGVAVFGVLVGVKAMEVFAGIQPGNNPDNRIVIKAVFIYKAFIVTFLFIAAQVVSARKSRCKRDLQL